MDRRFLRATAPLALAGASALLLAGCVYGVDDYSLPGDTDAQPIPVPPATEAPEAPEATLRLPAGCAVDDLRIRAEAPTEGELMRLVAVRILTVRVPEGGENADSSSTPDRLTIRDVDLGNGVEMVGDTGGLRDPAAWADFLSEQFRTSGLVSTTFGNRVVVSSFQPSLDEQARYVIGYVGDELRVPFTVTACDGSVLGGGELVGVDPAATGGSAVLRCGTDRASVESLTTPLAAYCDN